MKRKILALILALTFVLSAVAVPVSAAAEPTYEQTIPHINIHGFMSGTLYTDKNNPDSDPIWPPQGDGIKDAIFDLLPSLFKYIFTRNTTEHMEDICEAVNGLFGPLMCDSNGNPLLAGSGAYLSRPTKEEVLANPTIEFPYDWRVDPFETAKSLNEFINYLTDDLGFGQVVVECHSNGGTILLTYFSVYGTEKVRSCCFSASAVYGAGFAAELIQGRIHIYGDGLTEFLKSVLCNNEKAKLFNVIINICSKLGIINGLSKFLNNLLTDARDVFYNNSVIPIFGNWLNVWAMVPDDAVNIGKEYMGTYFNLDPQGEYKDFFAKVDNYTDKVRNSRETVLNEINDNCNLYIFSFYDCAGIPITADWSTMSDGVLHSEDTSFGAQFKPYGSSDTFPAGEDVSPDGKCDASSARFKDQTWFFKDVNHMYKCDYLNEMAKVLLYSDGQATVDTYEKYPQFLMYDLDAKEICPAK